MGDLRLLSSRASVTRERREAREARAPTPESPPTFHHQTHHSQLTQAPICSHKAFYLARVTDAREVERRRRARSKAQTDLVEEVAQQQKPDSIWTYTIADESRTLGEGVGIDADGNGIVTPPINVGDHIDSSLVPNPYK